MGDGGVKRFSSWSKSGVVAVCMYKNKPPREEGARDSSRSRGKDADSHAMPGR